MLNFTERELTARNFGSQAEGILSELSRYKYFYKELAAALKFNPLSKKHPTNLVIEKLIYLLKEFSFLIKPKALIYKTSAYSEKDGIVIGAKETKFKSRKLAENFILSDEKKSADIFIYVVTIGEDIDNQIKNLADAGDVFESYMLNGIGGAAAEMVAHDLNIYLNDAKEKSLKTFFYNRYSPGYGDWDISDQKKIFRLLTPNKFIGVNLSDSFLMYPSKSTSGIIGLADKPPDYITTHSGKTN